MTDSQSEDRQEKLRRYRRAWYARNFERARAKTRARVAELETWFRELKATLACQLCSENHIACLDFHHRNPDEKETNLAGIVHRGWSTKRILAEIAKCDVLCANCHRKVHFSNQLEVPIK